MKRMGTARRNMKEKRETKSEEFYDPSYPAELAESEAKSVSVALVMLADFLSDKDNHEQPAEKIREEIIDLISPLVEPLKGEKTKEHLEKVVTTINNMDFKARWRVYPAQALHYKPRITKNRIDIKLGWIRYSSEIGPKRFLKLGNEKWFVSRDFDGEFSVEDGNSMEEEQRRIYLYQSLRRKWYGTIITALEDGTFVKLKRCKQCRRFFVGNRLSDRFCESKCSKAHFGGDAAKARVYESRERTRRGIENLSRFMQLLQKEKHTRREKERIKPILKELGKGEISKGWKVARAWKKKLKAGAPPKNIWKKLPDEARKLFEKML